ncbi:MAG TPA: hypothetical protein VGQ24_09420, partial [Gemmatimonadales bacterium]|nr:hypothetical protein [Gemmatimonadales bacterium]
NGSVCPHPMVANSASRAANLPDDEGFTKKRDVSSVCQTGESIVMGTAGPERLAHFKEALPE